MPGALGAPRGPRELSARAFDVGIVGGGGRWITEERKGIAWYKTLALELDNLNSNAHSVIH